MEKMNEIFPAKTQLLHSIGFHCSSHFDDLTLSKKEFNCLSAARAIDSVSVL